MVAAVSRPFKDLSLAEHFFHRILKLLGRQSSNLVIQNVYYYIVGLGYLALVESDELIQPAADTVALDRRLVNLFTNNYCHPVTTTSFINTVTERQKRFSDCPAMLVDVTQAVATMKTVIFFKHKINAPYY
jgi:hypothetical protein